MGELTINVGGVGLPPENEGIVVTSIDVFCRPSDGVIRKLGYAQQINPSYTRNVTSLRMLDKNLGGVVVELQPQPETITLQVMGFAIYRASTPARMLGLDEGSEFNSLSSNKRYLDLFQVQVHPGKAELFSWSLYKRCLLTNWTEPANLGTSTITSTVSLACSFVVKGNWLQTSSNYATEQETVKDLVINTSFNPWNIGQEKISG